MEPLGFKIAYAPTGIVIALVFIGLPFAVRTLQPVLETLGREQEEAAQEVLRRNEVEDVRQEDAGQGRHRGNPR